jgi:hypothetical protein
MRLFRLGSLFKNNRIGIRVIAIYTLNPFKQIIESIKCIVDYKKMGLIIFVKIFGFRATIVLNKKINKE